MATIHYVPDQIKPRVLIVDNEGGICQALGHCLDKIRFQINYAASAAVAYTLLEDISYDVIVTAVMLPDADGAAFLARVRKAWPEIPVIIMAGDGQLQLAVNAIGNGAFDFMQKPFNSALMRSIVERAVNYTRLQRLERKYRDELQEIVAYRTVAHKKYSSHEASLQN